MSSTLRSIGIALCFFSWSRAAAQTTEIVSLPAGGGLADNWSYPTAISADGRYVAFSSYATNIVPGDTNGGWDVFVRDRLLATTEHMSVDSSGVEADGPSGTYSIALSADGRYVAFFSDATNLVAGDTNDCTDAFVHDRITGSTERVSVDGSGIQGDSSSTYGIAISGDGRYVAYMSQATQLVAGDTNGVFDVFVRDRVAGTTERVSVDSGGVEGNDASAFNNTIGISADGRYVVFGSRATNLVAGDTNGFDDVFVHDRQTGATTRASVDSGGLEAAGASRLPSISADGRCVVFLSEAANLVPGDSNGCEDVFVHDLQAGTTTRASINSSGVQQNQASGDPPTISGDGRYVAFTSGATNLAFNWAQFTHAYVHDRQTGITAQADVRSDGAKPDSGTYWGATISADGRFAVFSSVATDLVAGDTNDQLDAFVHDFLRGNLTPFCFGDGTGAACPCANSGAAGRGCQNSATTGGAILEATGVASLANDTLRIACHAERASALSVFLQGDATLAPVTYGDGLRCVGGSLKRLFAKNASFGLVAAPVGSDPSISARSAALGDPIATGQTRSYQVYYRDPEVTFCPDPPGNTWNVSNAVSAVWDP